MNPRPAPSVLSLALSLLLVAGCDRATDTPAGDAPARATELAGQPAAAPMEPEGELDATRVVDRAPVAGAGEGFDVRAFSGGFEADGVRLVLAPDGTYILAANGDDATGNWSVEDEGQRIRLDPDSKDEGDRVFAVVSRDELAPDDGGQALRRVGD